MKYFLRIEGTKEEIEKAATYHYDCFEETPEFGDNPIPFKIEFKIVEPFRYEFNATLGGSGEVDLTDGLQRCKYYTGEAAGKKVKVTIQEVE